jgi:hypothetical protein
MTPGRWIDQSQPERLVQGTVGLYITGAFDILGGLGGFVLLLAIGAAKIYGGRGIANERKRGYSIGVAAAGAGVLMGILRVTQSGGGGLVFALFGLVIDGVVFGFLIDRGSRGYVRIWFK